MQKSEKNSNLNQLIFQKFEEWKTKKISKIQLYSEANAIQNARQKLEVWKSEYTDQIRSESKKKSDEVMIGKNTEKFIPFLSDFLKHFRPDDVKFLGDPIDFVIFKGHSLKEGEISIYLAEVKTGDSKLNEQQKKIKDAVMNRRIY